jgi:hypothetical protein
LSLGLGFRVEFGIENSYEVHSGDIARRSVPSSKVLLEDHAGKRHG